MKRRTFLVQTSILTTGFSFRKLLPVTDHDESGNSLYSIFKNPPVQYRPFVRWWWNGDKIERGEMARELRLLKDAGIGGVEINPIKFPARTDDLGKRSLQWLSPEWIEMLDFTFKEAKSLGLTCDLIVGSGWPFGAEWLEGEERAQGIVIGTKKLEGPLDYEVSLFDLFKEADPAISSPFPGRKMEMLSVQLAPSVINKIEDVKDLSDQISTGTIRCKVPEGKYILYALVRINGFMQVIQGAPGATGPVLNHYNEPAVKKYLSKMSDAIRQNIGPLSSKIRSLFTDSLELEGANWCSDMAVEFQKRRGYDLMPWLPFVLYKIMSMGNVWDYDHGAEHGSAFKEKIRRIRYDFELTKTELIRERFLSTFLNWCKENKVQSRVQAYGRGYFPLEGSFDVDIPECETWIREGLGTEMSETDYRIGRAYTMVNKYVSSAAHLKGKKLVSCEELTNIHSVFNESLEQIKIAADQSMISGTTHSIFHGFNYSPPAAAFPGWVIYGTFINERNPWWPYFKKFADYKTRLSALLQQATMFADIAILPATADLWSIYGAQNDPFPSVMYPEWQTLVWEAIHQNGLGCDYISEKVVLDSTIENGWLKYGPRKYQSVFLTQVDSMEPATAKKLFDFVSTGGRIFFIETFPSKAPGLKDQELRDTEVKEWIEKIQGIADKCILLTKPGKDHTGWFKYIQAKYFMPYVKLGEPNKFISQVRYQAKDMEMILFVNSNMNAGYEMTIAFSPEILLSKHPWIWDAETGERYKVEMKANIHALDIGPAESKLVVFDKESKGNYKTVTKSQITLQVTGRWSVKGNHVNGKVISLEMDDLKDLKDFKDWEDFCGSIIYRNTFMSNEKMKIEKLDLGKVFGVAELFINGKNAGTKWYGRRYYDVKGFIKPGDNSIEIKVTTTMGNYLKSLKDNRVAQYWTNEGRTIQPIQSSGLLGPVIIK